MKDSYGLASGLINDATISEKAGSFEKAEAGYLEAIAVAESVMLYQVSIAAQANLSKIRLIKEEYAAAQDFATSSLETANRIGDQYSAAIAMENLALANAGLAMLSCAAEWVTKARSVAGEINDGERLFSLTIVDLEIKIMDGQATRIIRPLKQALKELASNGFTSEKPRLLRLLTHAHFASGNFADAKAHVARGMAEAQKQGNFAEQIRLERLQQVYCGGEYELDNVTICEYQETWPKLFQKEEKNLRCAFGTGEVEIYHIGSTSVKGLPAKDLIDILVAVPTLGEAHLYEPILRSLGYIHQSVDDDERLCFRKGMPRTHHVHVVQKEGWHYLTMLKFRDYLRENEAVAREYAALKKELAEQFCENRESYTHAKRPFITRTLAAAYVNQPELCQKWKDRF